MALFKARHRRRAKFTLWRGLGWIGSLSSLVLVIGLGFQWLVPQEWVEWQMEAHLSQALQRPVELEGARLKMFPLPRVHAEYLVIGDANARMVEAKETALYLNPMGLLRGRLFRRIQAEQVALDLEELLSLFTTLAGSGEGGFSRLEIDRLGFTPGQPLGVTAPGLQLTGFADGRWSAELSRDEQRLTLRGRPQGTWLGLELESSAWTLFGQRETRLQELSATLRLVADAVELRQLKTVLAQGSVRGSGRVHREEGADWRLEGSLTLTDVPVELLPSRLGLPAMLGSAEGTLFFSAAAGDLAKVSQGIRITGELQLSQGQLRGMDLARPAQTRGIGEFSGGDTRFDELMMVVEVAPSGRSFELVRLHSAQLTARGEIRVQPGERLEGRFDVNLSSAPDEAVPLLLGGALDAPIIRLAPGAIRPDSAPEQSTLEHLQNWWGSGPKDSELETPNAEGDEKQQPVPWILDYE